MEGVWWTRGRRLRKNKGKVQEHAATSVLEHGSDGSGCKYGQNLYVSAMIQLRPRSGVGFVDQTVATSSLSVRFNGQGGSSLYGGATAGSKFVFELRRPGGGRSSSYNVCGDLVDLQGTAAEEKPPRKPPRKKGGGKGERCGSQG